MQPRLDDGAIPQKAAPLLRRRKKCRFTPPASAAAASASGSVLGHANATTLASQLPYARSSTYPPLQQSSSPPTSSTPSSNESGDSGSPAVGNGSPGPVVPGDLPSVCAAQSTVTVTNQYTVTVTLGAQEAASAGSVAPASNAALAQGGEAAVSSTSNSDAAGSAPIGSSIISGASSIPAQGAQTATTDASSSYGGSDSSSNGPQGAEAGISAALNASLQSLAVPSSTAKTRTKCSKATGTVYANASAAPGVFPPAGRGPYGTARASGIASLPSGTGLSAPPAGSTAPIVTSNSTLTNPTTSTNDTSDANVNGEFWAGATLGTLVRMEAIPGRVFYDYDGVTVKDPFKTLGDAGVNAIRIEGQRGQCLGPTHFVNNGSTLGEELTFSLDWGCLDTQVQAAQRGVAQGMRVVLTINQGFNIPAGMESYSYSQMVGAVQDEAKRQLQPFLEAKIVPDIILFENEGSDGFLFNETATGHTRGSDDGKASKATVDQEKCGMIPTGNMDSFPQYAGYLKAEVIACNEAISAAGYSLDTVRYGLHSHGQYVQWKESVVHGPNPGNQTFLVDSSGKECASNPIPQSLLSQNVSEMLTIAGFSAYLDPMTPVNINGAASQRGTLNRLTATLKQLEGYAESYGKYTDGPFKGQYKLQSLGVEYGSSFTYSQIPQEQELTEMMWKAVKSFSNVLGFLWYEPWYCHGDWEGGHAALCHDPGHKGISGEAPTNTLKTWGAGAVSPWK